MSPNRAWGASATAGPFLLAAIFIAVGPTNTTIGRQRMTVRFSPSGPAAALADSAPWKKAASSTAAVPGRSSAATKTEQGLSLSLRNLGIQRVTLYAK